LFINRSYWPDAEATGQLLTELCEDLAPEFAVTVYAGQPNQNPDGATFRRRGWQTHQGVTIRRVPHTRFNKRSLLGRALNIMSYLFMTTMAGLLGPRPDIVVVETDPPLLCLLGALLRYRFGCRLIVYLQDLYPDLAVALGKLQPNWLVRFLRRRFFAVYRRADRVVVLSRDMQRVLVDSGVCAERVVCIANWVDAGKVRPVKQGNAMRAQWNPENRFLVMYSGNMGLCQHLEDVIGAAELLQAAADISFLLVGDGASRQRLEDMAAQAQLPNVRFLPYQSKGDLSSSLSAADVHLVPIDSRVYNFLMPSKLYGVLASGTPLLAIAPPHSELAEMTVQEQVGLAVTPDQPRALADAILWCAGHRGELAEMGTRARRLAEERFDRRPTTRRFAQMLSDVAAGSDATCETAVDDDVAMAADCHAPAAQTARSG
jgi:glycosyltransferase involved in cell wall biosynthesis